MTTMKNNPGETLKVGLIGCGAIGSVIAQALDNHEIPNAELTGVVDDAVVYQNKPAGNVQELIDKSSLIVEAAGHNILNKHGETIIQSGTDLLVVSIGALADEQLYQKLASPAPSNHQNLGRLYLTTGAIGGLDTLKAASLLGEIGTVEMASTKPAANLCMSWMDEEMITALKTGDTPVIAYRGPARTACRLFPASANVCATLALATAGFDRTMVTMIGDPKATNVTHQIQVSGDSGTYDFTFQNVPSPSNSKTSGIVPYAVIRGLRDIAGSDHRTLI